MAFPALYCSPAVFGPTPDGVVVAFETVEAADAYVEYGPSADEISLYDTQPTLNSTLHAFTLAAGTPSLPAGSAIYYRVLGRATGQGSYEVLQVDGVDAVFTVQLAREFEDETAWAFEFGAGSQARDPQDPAPPNHRLKSGRPF